MVNNWTPATELKFLLAIVETCNPKPSWKLIAAHMGEGFTDEAVRQHFAKLKKSSTFTVSAAKETAKAKPAQAAGQKRGREPDDSDVSASTEKTRRPRKLKAGHQKVGAAAASLDDLKVSPRKRGKKAAAVAKEPKSEPTIESSGDEAGESTQAEASHHEESA